MGTSHRQTPVKDARRPRPRRPAPSCSARPTATRSCSATAARPRSGTPPRSASSASARCTSSTASSRASSRRSPRGAPFLGDPIVVEAEPGDAPAPAGDPGADVVAWAHNETSTGVMVARAPPGRRGDALVLIDATSGAGGLPRRRRRRPTSTTSRRRSASRSDGGLWLALLSPAALERIDEIAATDRWIPEFLSLATALDNSRKDQTYNTPARRDARPARRPARVDARATAASTGASRARPRRPSTSTAGRRRRAYATPFVADPAKRSLVVGTIDFADERRRRRTSPRRCAPTASSTSSPTASSAATSCASRCSRRSSPPTSRR